MTATPDQIFEVARKALSQEARDLVEVLSPTDFTMRELIALIAVLQPVYDRYRARLECPPTPLKLIRRPKKPSCPS